MGIEKKYDSLKKILASLGRVVLGYSGGVDSSFLLKVAADTLGARNVLGCIGVSSSLADSQHKRALETAGHIGVKVRQVRLAELDDPNYSANKADRCFHCKSHLYGVLKRIAAEEKFDHIICGSNFDDKDDFRPGNRAAAAFGVSAPLAEARLTKEDIRQLSRELGLPTADMPASPCLASRVSYGLEVTDERLKQIEQAEQFICELGSLGNLQLGAFRVRHHGDIARIELPLEKIEKATKDPTKQMIVEKFKSLGFKYVTIDLQGFRSGSLNESLTDLQKQQWDK